MVKPSPNRRSTRYQRLAVAAPIALIGLASTAVNAALISPLEALRAAAPGLLQRSGFGAYDASHQPLLVARAVNGSKSDSSPRKQTPLRAPRTKPTNNSTSSGDDGDSSSNSTASIEGRYGHSAVYSRNQNVLYFVGGQLGENGTTVTNEVIAFNLNSTISHAGRANSSRTPDNPKPMPTFSNNLDPLAWAASTLDHRDRAWIIGGVTEDCEQDHVVHRLDLSNLTLNGHHSSANWTLPRLTRHAPPRRRQAQAVAIHNTTARAADIYVFGGIAEQYTCSDETIGYLGVDRYSTAENRHDQSEVESFGWTAPAGTSAKTFQPPVSDYTVTLLQDGRHVALIGGQNAHGGLANLSKVLIFDSRLRSWTTETATGRAPSPRMGHVAVGLPSGAILVHGGIGKDHVPVGDVHLLTPPKKSDTKPTWAWSTLKTVGHSSLVSPALAWHSATLLPSGTIVIAFGIDTSNGSPSDEISFLSVDEDRRSCSFTNRFAGEELPVTITSTRAIHTVSPTTHERSTKTASTTKHRTTTSKSKTKSKTKSKSKSKSASTKVYPEPYESTTTVAWTSQAFASQATMAPSTTSAAASQTTGATTIVGVSPVAASTNSDQSSSSGAQQTRTIAASVVGSLVGLVALGGVAMLLMRRRNSRKDQKEQEVPDSPLDMTRGGKGSAPLISSLMYTRPVTARNLSLGSTLSAVASSENEDDYGYDDQDFASSTGAVLGASHDPFSDQHIVNELGQTQVVGNVGPRGFVEAASASSAETQRRTNSLLEALSPSLSGSVKSIPFLAGLKRTDSGSSYSDNYTVRTPSQRSRRGPGGQAPKPSSAAGPSLPPGAGAPANRSAAAVQEYGFAVSKEQTPQANFMESRFKPASNAGQDQGPSGFAGVGAGSNATAFGEAPSIYRSDTPNRLSRPSTPLRVVNSD